MTEEFLERWLEGVLSTPGLTGLREPAEARRVLLEDALRARPLIERMPGSDRRRRVGRRFSGDPARSRAPRPLVHASRGGTAQVRASSARSLGSSRTSRSSGGGRRSSRRIGSGSRSPRRSRNRRPPRSSVSRSSRREAPRSSGLVRPRTGARWALVAMRLAAELEDDDTGSSCSGRPDRRHPAFHDAPGWRRSGRSHRLAAVVWHCAGASR